MNTIAISAHHAPTVDSAEPGDPPTVRHALASGANDPALRRVVLLRPSVAIRIDLGPWYLEKGDELEGTLMSHPSNTFRKIIIRTSGGTFNVNQEDVADVPRAELP